MKIITKINSALSRNSSHKITGILGLFTLLLVSSVSFGQTNIFTYGNSTATIPSGFVLTNNVATNVVDQGTYLLVDAGATSDYIVTPNYDLSGYTTATINADVATFGSGTAFPMKIEFSTNGGTSWNATTYTTATPSSATYITGGPIVITQTFTTTTKFRFSNNGTSGRGVRIQNLKLDGNGATAITSNAVTGNWSSTSSWVGGVVPTSSNNAVIVSGAVITMDTTTGGINTRNSGTSTTVNAGGTLATNVTYTSTGATTVNGTFQINQGGFANGAGAWTYGSSSTLIFNHTSGTYGPIDAAHTYWPSASGPVNVTVANSASGGINLGVARTVTGVFQTAASIQGNALTLNGTIRINAGGSFPSSPNYGSASTLIYNTGATFGRGNEWTTATSGAGYPANVQLSTSGTTVNMGASTAQCSGSITVDASTTLNTTSGGLTVLGSVTTNGTTNTGGALNVTGTVTTNGTITLGGDVTLSGTTASNWVVGATATQTNNSKAVFFTGATGTQLITKTAGGTVFFDYLVINKAAGSVQFSTGTDVTINTTTGDVVQLLNAGALDINGRTLTLTGAGGNISANAANRSITSTATGATLAITGSKSFSGAGTLIINTNVTTILSAGFDFGVSKVTVNGTLQLNFGGFASNGSAPTYASNSTLLFNTGGFYDVHNGSADVAGWFRNVASTGTAQAGVPWNVTISGNTSVRYNTTNTDNFPRSINGNLVINAGSAFTLGGISGTAGDFFLRGNWTNSGTFNPNSRLVSFNGTAAQTLNGATTFDYLTLDNTTGLTLAAGVTVNQTLSLTNGKITIGANTLTVGPAGTITGASTANYIVTTSTGQLKRTVGGSATLFAVGNTAYNPITFTNSGTSDVYGVRVANTAPAGANNTKTVTRQWITTEAVAGGSTLAVTAQYNTGEFAAAFTAATDPFIGHYNGTAYTGQIAATITGAGPFVAASNPTLTLSPSDLTTGTQYFAIGKDNGLLSVPSKYLVTAITPSSPTAGSGFSATVSVQDNYGSPTTLSANSNFSLTSNGNAGAISGTTTGTIASGQSTVVVNGIILATPGTGVTLTATNTSGVAVATPGTSATFTVLTPADHLTFGTAPPATGNVGANLTAFTVEARRPDNSLDNTFTGNITIAKVNGIGNLTGTLTVAAVAGVATFSAAQFDNASTFTIIAASGSLNSVTSGNIVVTLAPIVLAGWDFFTVTSGSPPATFAATTFNSNFISTSGANNVTRGSTAGASGANSSFRSAGFQNNGISTSNTDYFQTTLTTVAGYSLNLSSINAIYNGTTTYYASPGVTSQYAYSLDGTNFTLIGSPVTSTTVLSQVSVSTTGVTALQNIAPGTTVYIRYYASGQTTTGGWGYYSGTSGSNGLEFTGNIICAQPTAYAVTGGGDFCPSGTGVAVGLANSQSGISYQLKIGGTNTGSSVAGTGSAISFGLQTTAGTYTVVATNTNGTCNLSQTMTGSVVLATPTTTSTDGGVNWDNGTPTATKAVVFDGGTATLSADIAGCSLRLTNGATVTVASATDVTLTGAITVDTGSTFTLNNNANLLQSGTTNTNSGNIIVKRNSSALKRLDYTLWSSPVAGQGLYSFSPFTFGNRFYVYRPTTNLYNNADVGFSLINLNSDGVNGTDNAGVQFAKAKGYLIRMPWDHPTAPTVWNGTFTGIPNSGDIPFTMTNGGLGQRFNLVGNPYPSPISMTQFVSDNTSVATNNNNITGTLYFWRETNGTTANNAYCSWAGGTFTSNNEAQVFNPNGIIRIGQGFFVEALNASTTLVFNNGQRSGDNSNQFFRPNPNVVNDVETNRFWLNLTNAGGEFSQMAAGYMTNATDGVDLYDGKNINTGSVLLNSILDNTDYTIQGKSLPFTTSDVIPLSCKITNAGEYTIAIDHVDGLFEDAAQAIYLKDNLTSTEHNLQTGAYTFTSEAGTFANRFEIVYQSQLSNPVFTPNSVVIYSQDNDFVINSGNTVMSTVKVFDIRGRLLQERKGINASQTTINGGTTNQVLMVQITSEDGVVVTKKVIR